MANLVRKDINRSRNWKILLKQLDTGQIGEEIPPFPYVQFFPDGKIKVCSSKYGARCLTGTDKSTHHLINCLSTDYDRWIFNLVTAGFKKYGDSIFNV